MASNIVNLLSIIDVARYISLYLSDKEVYRLIECSKRFKDIQGLCIKKQLIIGEIYQMYIYRETKVNIRVIMNTPDIVLTRPNVEEVLINNRNDYPMIINSVMSYTDITLLLLDCPKVTTVLDYRIKYLALYIKSSSFDSDFFPKYLETLVIHRMDSTDGMKTLPETLITLELCNELPVYCKLPKSLKSLTFRYWQRDECSIDLSDTYIETLSLYHRCRYARSKLPKTLKNLSLGYLAWKELNAKLLPNLCSLTIIDFDDNELPSRDNFPESMQWLTLGDVTYRFDNYLSK